MKEKRIICLKGLENTGKTGTILELFKLLEPQSNRKALFHISQDLSDYYIHAEVWVKGKHIGLVSEGDVGEAVYEELKKLADNGCDTIFCTSRTKWASPDAVYNIAEKYHYTLIWTAPYTVEPLRTEDVEEKEMNKMKANHLEGFI
jgi:hypothetical protein